MIAAIAKGRKIYANLKKAIQYIISIHIPIVLTVSIPLLLGWIFPNIFSPVHVIFLELIAGTNLLIITKRAAGKNGMRQPPRQHTDFSLNWRELSRKSDSGFQLQPELWGVTNGPLNRAILNR